jgi:hypothetical protein
MNLSKFVGGDAPNSETTKRLNAGGSFSLIHIGPVSLVPEVYYSQKGARELASTTDQSGNELPSRQAAQRYSASITSRYRSSPRSRFHSPACSTAT